MSDITGIARGLKVGIVGGSIAGCATALELSRAGCEVMVFERSAGQLEGRGAGIASSYPHLDLLKERDLIDIDYPYVPFEAGMWTLRTDGDRAGRILWENPGGEIDANVEAIPPGEGVGHVEAPRGETFHYVRSDGTNRPARHKVRAPTFMNLPTYKATVVGETISDATIILAAIDPCYCCTERMIVRDAKGNKLYNGNHLIELSRQKTRTLKKKLGLK